MTTPDVEVRRSRRRRRTVSARREGERIVVLIPDGFSQRDEKLWVERMVARVTASERRRRPTDAQLHERARRLSERYLGGHARPASVRWVSNMGSRWGSCTTADGTIRLSDRLQGMPEYVVDYVLLHELAHLLVAGHTRPFWTLLASYPRLERARGFLEGVAYGDGRPVGADPGDDDPVDDGPDATDPVDDGPMNHGALTDASPDRDPFAER